MHLSPRFARFTLALAAAALLAAPAGATTLMRAGLDELVRGNETIVQGKVVEIHSYWNADHSFILTDVRVRPNEVFKGGVRRSVQWACAQPLAPDGAFAIPVKDEADREWRKNV